MIVDYITVLATKFKGVIASATDATVYENIVVDSSGLPLPSKEDLDAAVRVATREEMWKLIQAERDKRSQSGGYKVGTNWFHSDQASRTQQIALVILGAGLPPGIMWKTMGGTFVTMTQQLAGQIFSTAVQTDQQIFAAAEQHRGAMASVANPETYNYKTGWPQSYEDSLAV